MRILKLSIMLGLIAFSAPRPGSAVITVTQLADNIFVVSHRVKFIGSRGQAMRLAYTKAASVCVAAGYTHMEIKEQESQAGSEYETANASVRIKLFMEAGDDRLDCEKNANPEHIQEAQNKLAKMGYQPPDPAAIKEATAAGEGAATAVAAGETAGTSTGSCTIEQIVAMVKAGLEVEQIKAACPAE